MKIKYKINHKIKIKYQIILFTILLIIAYSYAILFAPKIENINDKTILGRLNKLHVSCIVPTNNKNIHKLINKCRGKGYFISKNKKLNDEIRKCLLTFWGLTHILLFFIVGFFCPDLIIPAIFIGIMFEVYEYIKFNCEDYLDFIWNTFGLLSGYLYGQYFRNK